MNKRKKRSYSRRKNNTNKVKLTGVVTDEEYFRVSDYQRKMYFRESEKCKKGRFLQTWKAKKSLNSI